MVGSVFSANCFTSAIIALRRVLLKEVHGLLVRIDLLIGICFVEILSGRTVKVVNELLMLGIELGGIGPP